MATKRTESVDEELPTLRRCGTDEVHYRLLLEVPEYARHRAAIENQAFRAAQMPQLGRSGCTRIPVVVHVVHRTSAENISQGQIDSQIAVLNADFRRTNSDIGTVPAAFAGLTADARVEFALATTDPTGNPTDGVTRTSTTVNGFGTDDAVKSAATGGADPWPSDQYLNIWVCRLAGGLLGYAQFPGGPAATDGVVITHTAFGTTGTAAAPFNLGRTTTHEVGHWLNLRHIWGDDAGACSGSDFVADTPNQGGPNYGTPTHPSISCGNGPHGDMFMNYMDYVDDVAMVMFSAGQVTRMQAALDGPRSSIGTAIPCAAGPKLKVADDPIPKGKFVDDPPKFKFRDDPPKQKFLDDPPKFKFRDDPPKQKFLDDPPKFKFRDDVTPKSKVTDDPPKSKFPDDVKTPGLDKPPGADLPGPIPGAGVAPFILATPHHSQAWQQSYPAAAQATLADYEMQLARLESLLGQYQQAEMAGELAAGEQAAWAQLYSEYAMLAEEYRQMRGG